MKLELFLKNRNTGVHIGATEPCICGDDAALCQITLTTCYAVGTEIISFLSLPCTVVNIYYAGQFAFTVHCLMITADMHKTARHYCKIF